MFNQFEKKTWQAQRCDVNVFVCVFILCQKCSSRSPEFGLTRSPLQERTGKLCGSWSRLPRKYRRILRAEEMQVSLATDRGTLTGRVAKYYGLTTEMFSGLLEGVAGAGTVILSVSPGTGAVHAHLLVQGLGERGERGVPLVLTFGRRGEPRGLEERLTLDTVTEVGGGAGGAGGGGGGAGGGGGRRSRRSRRRRRRSRR